MKARVYVWSKQIRGLIGGASPLVKDYLWAVSRSWNQFQAVSSKVRKRHTAQVWAMLIRPVVHALRFWSAGTASLSHMSVCVRCALLALWVWVSQLVRMGVLLLRAWPVPWVTSVWASTELLRKEWVVAQNTSTLQSVCGLTARYVLD